MWVGSLIVKLAKYSRHGTKEVVCHLAILATYESLEAGASKSATARLLSSGSIEKTDIRTGGAFLVKQ